jgi:hypothetical protein
MCFYFNLNLNFLFIAFLILLISLVTLLRNGIGVLGLAQSRSGEVTPPRSTYDARRCAHSLCALAEIADGIIVAASLHTFLRSSGGGVQGSRVDVVEKKWNEIRLPHSDPVSDFHLEYDIQHTSE